MALLSSSKKSLSLEQGLHNFPEVLRMSKICKKDIEVSSKLICMELKSRRFPGKSRCLDVLEPVSKNFPAWMPYKKEQVSLITELTGGWTKGGLRSCPGNDTFHKHIPVFSPLNRGISQKDAGDVAPVSCSISVFLRIKLGKRRSCLEDFRLRPRRSPKPSSSHHSAC